MAAPDQPALVEVYVNGARVVSQFTAEELHVVENRHNLLLQARRAGPPPGEGVPGNTGDFLGDVVMNVVQEQLLPEDRNAV